jgi:hypothetical protein
MKDESRVEDYALKGPINNWLVDIDKLDVLSALVVDTVADQPGILFISKHIWVDIENNPPLAEEGADVAVKAWLEGYCGVPLDQLRWFTIIDRSRITLNGFKPQKFPVFAVRQCSFEELLATVQRG